jgi:putative sugar O-methyltransferase
MQKKAASAQKTDSPSNYRGKQYPRSAGRVIVEEAKKHLVFSAQEMSIGYHWTLLNEKLQKTINIMTKVEDVINYAQTPGLSGFDHRVIASSLRPMIAQYEGIMMSEFPQLATPMRNLADSPYSRPETLLRYEGRLVSNMYYWQIMYLLQCLNYVKEPRVIGEIGGGYGGLARLWLKNPIHRPRCYLDIDFPESLFFTEVFLCISFPGLRVLYVCSPQKLDVEVLLQYQVILCPHNFVEAVADLSLDLVINTSSMQEMSDDWVDFWMQWLKKKECHWFYSVNYFASPLYQMQETHSTWSPRLTPEWTIKLQRFNPAFTQIHGVMNRNVGEILAQKEPDKPRISRQTATAQYQLMQKKIFDGQVLLESLDIVHSYPDEEIMWDLLQRCVKEMPVIPKESIYLAEYLNKHASTPFKTSHGEELGNLLRQLQLVRAGSQEKI